jgi:hypothetical protein
MSEISSSDRREQPREEFERRNGPAIRSKKIEENAISRVSSKESP